MKKRVLSIVSLVLIFSMAAQAAPRKKRVAVMDFDYATVKTSVAALFGSDVDVGKGISDLLVKRLVQDGTYSVIERQAISKIMAEQNFSNSDRADPNSAAKIGKLLGVDAIIVGAITQFGNDNKNTSVGGGGHNWGGFGIGGIGQKKAKAVVGLDARIINVDTGEIMAVAEGKGESERSSTSLLGGGGNWHGGGGGSIDMGSSDFENTIIGEAVKKAVDDMTKGVIDGNAKIEMRTNKVDALVAFVETGKVVLNVGSTAGLKVGDELTVQRVLQEIKDPSTGKVIRRMMNKLGTVQVSDVDSSSAVCNIVDGAGFKVGDHATTVTQ